ncbi:hypothetical protein PHYBOEH_001682 [Phytophthora boehmeriae]|uniref:Uncharacterized protein n=1 Tax=Phytophthora boehmeriae TaxID=109152 RepID=A0A8T1WRY2_9STRA|nr:hypothetical protein PHYBOEH_001682 [Phytophthora boehmeriae]
MPPSAASFFWVKYGFENTTPPKMYNANVSCAVLLSFVKNQCAKGIEDLCKQKNIQLSIELDALNRMLQARLPGSGRPGTAGSRKASSRPVTPTIHTAGTAPIDEEITEALAKKAATEEQLEVVAAASKLAKELIAGTMLVDLADDHGTRLKLIEANDARATTIVKHRAHFTAVAVSTDDKGVHHVVPLVFKLIKSTPEVAAPTSRPGSAAAKSKATT